jgi:hypothetical protein
MTSESNFFDRRTFVPDWDLKRNPASRCRQRFALNERSTRFVAKHSEMNLGLELPQRFENNQIILIANETNRK